MSEPPSNFEPNTVLLKGNVANEQINVARVALELAHDSFIACRINCFKKKTRLWINLSKYLYPVALLLLVPLVFIYRRQKSIQVRMLITHTRNSLCTHKSQKIACVCDIAFEHYRMLKILPIISSSISQKIQSFLFYSHISTYYSQIVFFSCCLSFNSSLSSLSPSFISILITLNR